MRSTLCWLAASYVRLMRTTGRWRTEGGDHPAHYLTEGKPFIVAFWHQRLLMMPYTWRSVGGDRPFNMLISSHRDGEIISRTIARFDIKTIAGSTGKGKGGAAALRQILKALKAGEVVGITPDGPRGPRMRASDGIIQAARMAGVPIFPLTYSASNRKVIQSWDRFILPLPFSRGVFHWGDPIFVDRKLDEEGMEAKRVELENALTELTQKTDQSLGLDVIPPAAPDELPKQKRSAIAAGETGS
ncbi:lysophospholipid acyltransferase family protein [Thalassospira sp.]|uniref:lysophospholipid acyltransferase family protein n=1 Tax=Thalassospira sp. TaxID=1912094 RepID=UPI001B084789|nr:lysophospholipid acyltransferase family protein [Thalassospira sp.]MBO6809294.1 lysophospholipid acyltransferase family protein [Thalassospira sp.]MBO6842453.1 lysophospholipid acyltransferase family protein [Thalassospira sp.]